MRHVIQSVCEYMLRSMLKHVKTCYVPLSYLLYGCV